MMKNFKVFKDKYKYFVTNKDDKILFFEEERFYLNSINESLNWIDNENSFIRKSFVGIAKYDIFITDFNRKTAIHDLAEYLI